MATWLVLVASSIATLAVIRHQGVHIGGDEPYYLVEAVSIGRFHTLNLAPAYNYSVVHHIIFPWRAAPGPLLPSEIGQGVPTVSHGLVLPSHAVGLSALLAVPQLLGTKFAVWALILMLSGLEVWVVQLVSKISGVRSPWRFALSGLFLAPPYLLATTQVYPDLLSGLIMAIVVLAMVWIETTDGGCTVLEVVGPASLLLVFPWLDQKNILYFLLLYGALLVTWLRGGVRRPLFGILILLPIVSLVCLIVLNLWGYGHLLGGDQSVSIFSEETFTRTLALIFDRRQGVLPQVPLFVVGLAGMWVWRRRAPVAVIASITLMAATFYGNATQQISFGGGSLVGRFEWPAVPIILAFAGIYLCELARIRRTAVWLVSVLAAILVVLEGTPVVLKDHLYFNQVSWDPARYKGWWGGLDPFPILGYTGRGSVSDYLKIASNGPTTITGVIARSYPWGNPQVRWGTVSASLLAAAGTYLFVALYHRPTRLPKTPFVAMVGGLALALTFTLSSPVLLPTPIKFDASALLSQVPTLGTGRLARGDMDHGTVIAGPYWVLLPGRYETTIEYHLADRNPRAALSRVIAITKPPDSGLKDLVARRYLSDKATEETLTFRVVRPESVVVTVEWQGAGSLSVASLSLDKTKSY